MRDRMSIRHWLVAAVVAGAGLAIYYGLAERRAPAPAPTVPAPPTAARSITAAVPSRPQEMLSPGAAPVIGNNFPVASAVALHIDAPARVVIGRSFTLGIVQAAGSGAIVSRVELAYDPDVVELRMPVPIRPGRALLDLPPPPQQLLVHFAAIGAEPSFTEISLEAGAFDATGRSVSISIPGPHIIELAAAP